ncbi:MAG TPA: hypothetical protein VGH63_11495 [Polyangia bacterium]
MHAGELSGGAARGELGAESLPRVRLSRQCADSTGPPPPVVLVQVLQERERGHARVGRRLQRRRVHSIDDAAVVVEEEPGEGDVCQLRCVRSQRRQSARG